MKFYQRFAYYLVGLVMGSFVVTAIFIGKDTRCNYFPNARVLNDIRTKPFYYSPEAEKTLAERWVDTADIRNTLTYGDVDFDKSNVMVEKAKLYTVDGQTTKKQQITIEILNYPDKAVLRSIHKR